MEEHFCFIDKLIIDTLILTQDQVMNLALV